jgi:hypothetical protein
VRLQWVLKDDIDRHVRIAAQRARTTQHSRRAHRQINRVASLRAIANTLISGSMRSTFMTWTLAGTTVWPCASIAAICCAGLAFQWSWRPAPIGTSTPKPARIGLMAAADPVHGGDDLRPRVGVETEQREQERHAAKDAVDVAMKAFALGREAKRLGTSNCALGKHGIQAARPARRAIVFPRRADVLAK